MVEVTIPQAPDNLVGISQHDHMIWVPRRQLQSLTEHVLGMTQMPSIARMKALAGITAESDQKPIMHVVAQLPPQPLNSDLGWLHELRMHMKEIEQLSESPDSVDHQEEMQLHMKALSRKASRAAGTIKGLR